MKKVLFVFSAAILLLAIFAVGCQKNEDIAGQATATCTHKSCLMSNGVVNQDPECYCDGYTWNCAVVSGNLQRVSTAQRCSVCLDNRCDDNEKQNQPYACCNDCPCTSGTCNTATHICAQSPPPACVKNGVCNSGENCGNCASDCPCAAGTTCNSNGVCAVPASPGDVDLDGYKTKAAPYNGNDCDDNNKAINPGVAEICDKKDNDCDGLIDEGTTKTFYVDYDKDGYGDKFSTSTVQACTAPAGYSLNKLDCNDKNAAIRPGVADPKDGIDNNCNGVDGS
jgi:hypothetical protein